MEMNEYEVDIEILRRERWKVELNRFEGFLRDMKVLILIFFEILL